MKAAAPTLIPVITAETLVPWINRGLEFLWLLTVVLVPLAFVERGDLISASAIAYLEVPKIALLRTLAGLMAILWLTQWAIQTRFSFGHLTGLGSPLFEPRAWAGGLFRWLGDQPTRWLTLAVIFFLCTILISTLLSASFEVSLWGEVPGEDGYAAYTMMAYGLLFAVIATHLRTRAQVWRLLSAIALMGTLVAGFAMLQHYGHDVFGLTDPPNTTRATATMGNPILAGAVLLMTIPVSLATAAVHLRSPVRSHSFWWKSSLWSLVLAVQLLGMLFTDSRGPWASLVLALAAIIAMALVFAGWRLATRIAWVLVLASAITAAVLIVPSDLNGGDAVVMGDPASDSNLAAASGEAATSEKEEVGGTRVLDHSVNEVVWKLVGDLGGRVTARGGLQGRVEIWRDSWNLMVNRPWFEFDSLSLSFLRPLIGYGPDLFRYTYMVASPPRGGDQMPRESVHAHNYFIHQGVEAGFLGLMSSLGIFVAPLLVGGYQLLWKRRDYHPVQTMVLIALLGTLGGRGLEQMTGLARVSDLTVFWVLLGIFVALPVAMKTPKPRTGVHSLHPPAGSPFVHRQSRFDWPGLWRLAAVGLLIAGIGVLTWVKTINYPRAGFVAAAGMGESRQGNHQSALASLDRAVDLAPGVWLNYNRQAAVYSIYRSQEGTPQEPSCGGASDRLLYEGCLAERAYLANRKGAEQRPFNFRAGHAAAISGFELAEVTGDRDVEEQSLRHLERVTALVPAGWPLFNQLAVMYLIAGESEGALAPLEKGLAITKDNFNSANAFFFRGIAYRNLDQPLVAIEEFDEALRLDPLHHLAYTQRGFTYWLLGQPQRTLADLDKAIKSYSEFAEGFSNRGFVYRELGDPQKAIKDLDRAITIQPEYPEAYNNRGLAYLDLGDYQQAVRDYGEAIRLSPTYGQAYVNRGAALVELGQPERAVSDAERAINLDPQYTQAYALRAIAYTMLGRATEASSDLDQAVGLGFDGAALLERIRTLQNGR